MSHYSLSFGVIAARENIDIDTVERVMSDVFALPEVDSLTHTPIRDEPLFVGSVLIDVPTSSDAWSTLRNITGMMTEMGWDVSSSSIDPVREINA